MKLSNKIFNLDINGNNSFLKSLELLLSKELPIKDSWNLSKFLDAYIANNKIFTEKRHNLIKKYGKLEDEVSGTYSFSVENSKKFEKEYMELLSIEQEYDFNKIKLPDDIKITPKTIIALKDILKN